MKHEIDLASHTSVADAIRAGLTTPSLIAAVLDVELVDGCLVIKPGYFANDGNFEEHYKSAASGREAA